jgi:hypothetical protein
VPLLELLCGAVALPDAEPDWSVELVLDCPEAVPLVLLLGEDVLLEV